MINKAKPRHNSAVRIYGIEGEKYLIKKAALGYVSWCKYYYCTLDH